MAHVVVLYQVGGLWLLMRTRLKSSHSLSERQRHGSRRKHVHDEDSALRRREDALHYVGVHRRQGLLLLSQDVLRCRQGNKSGRSNAEVNYTAPKRRRGISGPAVRSKRNARHPEGEM